MSYDKDFLQELASQLSCPKNEDGIEVANNMHEHNIGMTKKTIEALYIAKGDQILELGHGSCKHLPEILNKAENVSYDGLEVSTLMHQQAAQVNNSYTKANQAFFHLYNGQNIPFSDNTFNKILTVNTIYFWQNPETFIKEIYRVLKPDGLFSIGFADREFMESLPFTVYGFKLYDKEQLHALVAPSGFNVKNINPFIEKVASKTGDEVERLFYVAVLGK